MARPLRIQYNDACYHVINRGRNHQDIFHGPKYYKSFLRGLREAHERFGMQIHAYCLMTNHYHLFVRTPNANLGRAMRHVNGVYTQRYNKMANKDGQLMRGRYKALLVDQENYWIQLSRYIHRNPIDTTPPMVENLEDYLWSSFPAFLSLTKAPGWLFLDDTLKMFGSRNQTVVYKNYVDQDNDEMFIDLMSQKHKPPVLGDAQFLEQLKRRMSDNSNLNDEEIVEYEKMPTVSIKIDDIVAHVATFYGVDSSAVFESKRSRGNRNIARSVAMYLCQQVGDYKLTEIASAFDLHHYGSAAGAISNFRQELENDDKLRASTFRIVKSLNPKT